VLSATRTGAESAEANRNSWVNWKSFSALLRRRSGIGV
jgi:hypothetical protein